MKYLALLLVILATLLFVGGRPRDLCIVCGNNAQDYATQQIENCKHDCPTCNCDTPSNRQYYVCDWLGRNCDPICGYIMGCNQS